MRKLLLCVFLFCSVPLWAQQASISGNLTAAGTTCANPAACLVLNLFADASTATVQISGSFSATLQFEGTADGSNWIALVGDSEGTFPSSSTTTTGLWTFSVPSLQKIRVRCSTFTSAPTVYISATAGHGFLMGATGNIPLSAMFKVVSSTDSNVEETWLAADASKRWMLTGAMCTNVHATTSTLVGIYDTASGAALAYIPCKAAYGDAAPVGTTPIPASAVNKPLIIKAAAAVSTLYLTLIGYYIGY